MSATAFHVAHKAIETRTVTAVGAIAPQRCVGYDSLQVSVVGATSWGISNFSGIAGDRVTIVTEGSAVAEAGAAIAIGQPLASGADGRLSPATTGQFVFARALGSVSAAGRFLEVHITREGVAQ